MPKEAHFQCYSVLTPGCVVVVNILLHLILNGVPEGLYTAVGTSQVPSPSTSEFGADGGRFYREHFILLGSWVRAKERIGIFGLTLAWL